MPEVPRGIRGVLGRKWEGCAKADIKGLVFTYSMKSFLGDTCILVGAHEGFKKTAAEFEIADDSLKTTPRR